MSGNYEKLQGNRFHSTRKIPEARQTNSVILRVLACFINPWRQFWRMSRDDGWLFTAIKVLNGFVPESIFHAKGFIIVTGEPHESPTDQANELGVRQATKEDLDLLSNCGYPQSILRRWFKRGARAWLIEREGKLLACYWLDGNDRYYLYDWLVIRSTPNDFWVLWWWVAHGYRRQDIAYQIRTTGVSEFARAGFTRLIGVVDSLNRNALRASQKLGWKSIGRLFILRILGITFVHFGKSLRIGRWSLGHALELPLEELMWKAEMLDCF